MPVLPVCRRRRRPGTVPWLSGPIAGRGGRQAGRGEQGESWLLGDCLAGRVHRSEGAPGGESSGEIGWDGSGRETRQGVQRVSRDGGAWALRGFLDRQALLEAPCAAGKALGASWGSTRANLRCYAHRGTLFNVALKRSAPIPIQALQASSTTPLGAPVGSARTSPQDT